MGLWDRGTMGKLSEWFGHFNIRNYGAQCDGSHDDTGSIRDCVAAAKAKGWGVVHCPGTPLLTDEVNVDGHRIHIRGDGRYATQFYLNPSGAKAGFRFQYSNTALVSYQCSIAHCTFIGHPNAASHQKIAIDAYDTSGLRIYDVASQSLTGNSGDVATPSTFFRSNGREATTVDFVEADAERPFWLRANANSASLDVDSFNFNDCYCTVRGTNEASYEFDSQIGVLNLRIGGRQAWVQGKYGIHWASSGAMRATAQNIHIKNGRFEQATANTGYGVYWSGGTNNLKLSNVGFGGVVNTNGGLYLRNTVQTKLTGCSYSDSAGEALNVDGTSDGIGTLDWDACFWQVGSTATLTGVQPTFESAKRASGAPLPPKATYVSTSSTLPANKFNGGALDHQGGTLADDASVTLHMSATGATVLAGVRVIMTETGGTHKRETAYFVVGDNGADKETGTANTTVGDVDGKLCLIYTSVNSITVKNRLGGTMNYKVWATYTPA